MHDNGLLYDTIICLPTLVFSFKLNNCLESFEYLMVIKIKTTTIKKSMGKVKNIILSNGIREKL